MNLVKAASPEKPITKPAISIKAPIAKPQISISYSSFEMTCQWADLPSNWT